jgi:hypothetical protein
MIDHEAPAGLADLADPEHHPPSYSWTIAIPVLGILELNLRGRLRGKGQKS